ncbi:DUF1294 domain-containing protein [Myroides sp. LJL115]
MKFLFIYLFIINYLAFTIFAHDKEQAIKNKRRVKEKNLLTLCFFGGSIGGYLAMKRFRHKTSKSNFMLKFYGLALFQGILLFMILKRG